jgi:hypothetical protein
MARQPEGQIGISARAVRYAILISAVLWLAIGAAVWLLMG